MMAASGVTVTVITDDIIGPTIQKFGSVPGGDITGGLAITGFVEVEKTLSFTNSAGLARTVFLEKKLPFQILLLDLDPENQQQQIMPLIK